MLKRSDISKALGFYVSDYHTKFGGSLMDANSSYNTSGNVEVRKQIKPILTELDSINAAISQMFSFAYTEYASNPCEKDELFKQRIDEIKSFLSKAIDLAARAIDLKERGNN